MLLRPRPRLAAAAAAAAGAMAAASVSWMGMSTTTNGAANATVAAAGAAAAAAAGVGQEAEVRERAKRAQRRLKREAGYLAVDRHVKSGMFVGLGTGSTAYYAVERVGQKLKSGELYNVVGVPTSNKTESHARSWGIPLVELDEVRDCAPLDVAIDGADEVSPQLDLVKGRGGALLREKIVEMNARQFVVIVDESKLMDALGTSGAMPVEVVQFSWQRTLQRILDLSSLQNIGLRAERRMDADGKPFVSDNGNFIVDLYMERPLPDAACTAQQLRDIVGVVEHGLFLNMADEVIVAGKDGVRVVERTSS